MISVLGSADKPLQELSIMKLRDHPLLCRTWPPAWWWRAGAESKNPRGEVGVLRDVRPYSIQPADRFYLIMEDDGAEYLGILLVEDYAFCQQLFTLLLQHCGMKIQDIGDIDLTQML
jgi:hypothetical protein